MDVLPLAVAAVPDAGLLGLHGAGHAVAVDVLGEADVGDAGRLVSDQVDVGVQQDGVDRLLGLGQSCREEQEGRRVMGPPLKGSHLQAHANTDMLTSHVTC